MKIQGGGYLPQGIPSGPSAEPAAGASTTFGDILRKTLEPAAASEPAGAPVGAGMSIRLHPAAPRMEPAGVVHAERFLDLLDEYRQRLADPRVSLKGLDSAVRAMEEGRGELAALLDGLSDGDGLKEVLNQTLVAAEMEIVRFRRGDYLLT
jgi:hypothetical protein